MVHIITEKYKYCILFRTLMYNIHQIVNSSEENTQILNNSVYKLNFGKVNVNNHYIQYVNSKPYAAKISHVSDSS